MNETRYGNVCKTLTILALLLVIPPTEAHDPTTGAAPFDVGGFGTPTINGVFAAGEWSAAGTIPFTLNLPGGGTTTATVYVMNDSTNIYFALRFPQSPTLTTSFVMEFDNNHNGVQDAKEDAFVANSDGSWFDDVRKSNGTAPTDVAEGGTSDGTTATGNDGTNTVIEVSKPLNSGDVNDFALSAGDTVGATIFVRVISGAGTADTFYPTGLNPSLYGDIRIYPLGPLAPIFTQPTSPACGSTFDQVALKQLTFPVAAIDPNPADSVTVTATTLPTGATYTPNATDPSQGTFAWTPTVADAASNPHTITFNASDGTLSTTCTMTVNVKGDTDGDGLPDAWELFGYTYSGEFVNLPAMGANPNVKDVFVEIDYMTSSGAGDSHVPDTTALNWIKAAFLAQGITLHVNVDQAIPHQTTLGSGASAGTYNWTAVDTIKAQIGTGGVVHFSPAKSLSIRYCIFAHDISTGDSGVARAGGSDFIVALGTFNGEISDQYDQAGTFMHELGHVLGLRHGGGDELNNKPNYLSVMNYLFQTTGLRKSSAWGTFDYSGAVFPMLNEGSLNEGVGLNAGAAFNAYGTRWILASTGTKQTVDAANGPINWNGTGSSSETGVSVDITGDGITFLPLNGYNDWANLDYDGGTIGTGAPIPQPVETPADELDQEILETTAPDALDKIKGHVSSTKLHLTWKPQGPQEDGYLYRVYRSVDGGVTYNQIGETIESNFEDLNVEAGQTYSYQVTWVLDGVESQPTDDITLELKSK